MALEALILLYFLKVFKILIILFLIIFICYTYYLVNLKKITDKNYLNISKGESVSTTIKNNFLKISIYEHYIFIIYYKFYSLINSSIIHYGDFYLDNSSTFNNFLNIVSKPSNILNKITIVEGWSKNDLDKELSKYFDNYRPIEYDEILADTYYFHKNKDFDTFLIKLKKYKNYYLENKKFKLNYNEYTDDQILIIGSLIEREGLDYDDKLKISSVINNRLNKKMKLQIDATVVYFITKGKNDLKRNLTYADLKIKNPYNTYIINGLPPKPISYVGTKTIDIILERYKSEFLFYFYNNIIGKHVFSEDYEKHKFKLNEYRKNK